MHINNNNLSKKILIWYDNNQRTLPWRTIKNSKKKQYYRLLSEFMLQQTQVKTVIPYFVNFVNKIPNLKVLSTTDNKKVLKLWEGLGYYRRVMYLKETCKQIIDVFYGNIPEDVRDLLTLKGIGNYTAAAVSSIAYQKPNPAIDGNVKRILSRIFLIPVFNSKIHKEMTEYLASVISLKHPGDFNQAMMELGF